MAVVDDPGPGASVANKAAVGLVILVAVGVVGLLGWKACRVPGKVVGEIVLPGAIELDLAAEAELAFTADTDVLWARPGPKTQPTGCVLDIVLVRDGKELVKTSCDLYRTSTHSNSAMGSSASSQEGKTRYVVSGQRLG